MTSQETVWKECFAIVHEAGDRAARLGLPQIVTKARRFRRIATPGEAQAILAECLAALTPATAAANEMLTLPEAAKLLGYTRGSTEHRGTVQAGSCRPAGGRPHD